VTARGPVRPQADLERLDAQVTPVVRPSCLTYHRLRVIPHRLAYAAVVAVRS
jgi:hypothetical protein